MRPPCVAESVDVPVAGAALVAVKAIGLRYRIAIDPMESLP